MAICRYTYRVMSTNFDWQTEEDGAWEESERVVVEPPVRRPPPWRFVLLILVALTAAGVVVYRQATQRIEAATEEVRADVLSSHRLVLLAALQKDVELASSLLSGRDPRWTEAQRQLVAQGLLVDRGVFGLRMPPDPAAADDSQENGAPATVAVTVASDFRSAELLFEQDYLIETGRPATQTVTLQQTAVYRQGSQRWLLAPPAIEFWGDRNSIRGDILTVSFPARDASVVERLAADLDAVLADVCRVLRDLNCPADLRVHLRLETSPATLVAIADPTTLLTGSLRLEMPSPTLIGIPLDEAGYVALYRGYATQLASAVITNLVGWACCDHAPVYQALLDYQLSQLDLRLWPVAAADHLRILDGEVSLNNLLGPWSDSAFTPLDEENNWRVYTAVDFLLQHFPAVAPATLQRAMAPRQGLSRWLFSAYPGFGAGSFLLDELDREWWLYAYTQTLASQEPLPVPLPQQDIQLLCMAEVPNLQMSLYRYHAATEAWVGEIAYPGFVFMNPLPDDDGLILQSVGLEGDELQTQLWRHGAGVPLSEGNQIIPEGSSAFSMGQTDPTGQRLLGYTFQPETGFTEALLIRFRECEGGICPTQLLPGPLVWSPSGDQAIAVESASFFSTPLVTAGRVSLFGMSAPVQSWTLLRQSSSGALTEGDFVEVGQGYAPFWLDDMTYGFVEVTSGTRQALMVASVNDDDPRPLLDSADLSAALTDGVQPASLQILYAIASPLDPNLLFVVALDSRQNEGYLFLFDRAAGHVELRLRLGPTSTHMLAFSPDGRWLSVTGTSRDIMAGGMPTAVLYLHSIAGDETRTFITDSPAFTPTESFFDWSADGQWLALIMDSGLLNLIAPDHDYQHLLRHDFGRCAALAWLNP